MRSILLTNTNPSNQTMISNIFIDTYMPSANGSYVKVYLYLLRCLSSQRYDLSISFLADCLDNTENDIIRALNYWEKYRLITIGRDTNGDILNITINPLTENTPSAFPNANSSLQNSALFHSNVTALDKNINYLNQNVAFGNPNIPLSNSNNILSSQMVPLSDSNHMLSSQMVPLSDSKEATISSSHMIQKNKPISLSDTDNQNSINNTTTILSDSIAATITSPSSSTIIKSEPFKTDRTTSNLQQLEAIPSNNIYNESDSEIDLSISTNTQVQFPRPTYTSAQIDAMSNHEDIKWLLKIIPMYLDRTLRPTDVQLILYFYETLGFSTELITHLYDYCVSKNKKSLSYIETVALSWAEEGIDTVEKAQQSTIRYNTNYNAVNKAFGLNRSPGTAERKFIDKWVNTYHFNSDIIIEACSRALLNLSKPDFKYANTILECWFEKGVKNIDDVQKLDELHNNNPTNIHNKTTTTSSSERPVINSSNKFSAFPQRTYTKEDYSTLEQKLLNKH